MLKNKKILFILIIITAIILSFSYHIYKYYSDKYSLTNSTVKAVLNDFISGRGFLKDYINQEQGKIDILNYKMSIDIYPEKKSIKSSVIIKGVIKKETENIILNFYDCYTINSFLLNSKECDYRLDDGKIFIPGEFKKNESFEMKIAYEGNPPVTGWGAFNFDEYNGDVYVTTINEPIFASAWFPCNDKPDDKALYEIDITNQKDYTSISNGLKTAEIINGNYKTTSWKTNYPVASYLVSIYSGRYVEFSDSVKSISGKMIPLRYYVFPDLLDDAKKDFEGHKDFLPVLESLFGEYPFQTEKYGVALNFFTQGAMENQTITGLGYNYISGRNFFRDILIHELAHQWCGNSVTLKSWDDIWLNEGFASYAEALYYEKKYSKRELMSTLLAKKNFKNDRLFKPEGSLFSTTVYNKGAWVLHMLRNEIGDKLFFDILKKYFTSFRYSNVSTKSFQKFLETNCKRSFKKFFEQWVYNGDEILDFKTEIKNNCIYLVQNSDYTFHFPLFIKIFYSDGTNEMKKFYITSKDTLLSKFNKKIIKIIPDPESEILRKN